MDLLEQYRVNGNKVLFWDNSRECFRFVGTLGKRTLLQFIEDHNNDCNKSGAQL